MLRFIVPLAVVALVVPTALSAHHGWSSYNSSKVLNVTGKLQSLSWSNPHGRAKIVYNKQSWDVILAPVSRMEARGLTREMVAPNRTVKLVGYPRSDGTREMRIERVIANGKTIELR